MSVQLNFIDYLEPTELIRKQPGRSVVEPPKRFISNDAVGSTPAGSPGKTAERRISSAVEHASDKGDVGGSTPSFATGSAAVRHDSVGSSIAASWPLQPAFVCGSDTSEEAARSMTEASVALRERVLDIIRQNGSIGATCESVESRMRASHQTISARISELKASGAIVDSGKRGFTRSGRKACVYVANGLGR